MAAADLSVLVTALSSLVATAVAHRLEKEGWEPVRPSWGYVLQHLVTERVSAAELGRRTGTSRQAATKAVHELRERGLVETDGNLVGLTGRGRALIDASRRIRAELDEQFAAVTSAAALRQCRRTLVTLIDALGGTDAVATRRLLPT